jgi:hypothetical protein
MGDSVHARVGWPGRVVGGRQRLAEADARRPQHATTHSAAEWRAGGVRCDLLNGAEHKKYAWSA